MSSKTDTHELVIAARGGETERLKAFLKKGALSPISEKCQRALFFAVQGNHLECAQALLEGGTPLGAAYEEGNTPLHEACAAGHLPVLKLLLDHKANWTVLNTDGITPLSMATKAKPPHFDCVKELLRRGAQPTSSDSAVRGLAQAMKEIQIERMTGEVRKLADIKVDENDILVADTKVWEAQRHHMRLVLLKEEQKAGTLLVDLERRIAVEQAEEQASAGREAEAQEELKERRIMVQATTQDLTGVLKELEDVRLALSKLQAQYDGVDADVKAQKGQSRNFLKAKEESDKQRAESEEARDRALAECSAIEDEITEARKKRDDTRSELSQARTQLRGYMKDREHAAMLTEQAKQLLT